MDLSSYLIYLVHIHIIMFIMCIKRDMTYCIAAYLNFLFQITSADKFAVHKQIFVQ